MLGEDYRIKITKYKGQELKNIPASYLIFMFDTGYLHWDKPAHRFVNNNYDELRELSKKQ